ncbi:MAG: hypothetical protein K2M07_02445 [Muribaculaceae bacterium]|nr:hypothetical protein [Muribaculaceae bacterium]
MTIHKILPAILLLCTAIIGGCRSVDDDRIPPAPVRIAFPTVAEWQIYGTPGATDHRRFIKSEKIPSNFPWTALTETGFGGVLLCSDIHGAPVAYDLACPVEIRADVRIIVDQEALNAYCPRCHSVYDIFTNYGQPLSGPAAEDGYGLQKYYVGAGAAGEYMVVTRR